MSRVAPAHCCAEAPSEPDWRLSPHPAQASPAGLQAVRSAGGGVVADVVSSLTSHVCETTAKGIRRANTHTASFHPDIEANTLAASIFQPCSRRTSSSVLIAAISERTASIRPEASN
jgi:hypothetical protein